MKHTALLEIDLKKGQILFAQVGFLKDYLEPRQIYDYDKAFSDFLENAVHPDDRENTFEMFCLARFRQAVQNREGHLKGEFRIFNAELGAYQWYSLNAMLNLKSNQAFGMIVNIHEQKLVELKLQYQTKHDSMTGVLNRAAFHTALLSETKKEKFTGMYVLLDLDDFKQFNEKKGHSKGDAALKAIAACLQDYLPEDSILGRFGGDRLNFFIPGIAEPAKADVFAHDLLDRLHTMQENQEAPTVSMGISFFPEHGQHLEDGLYECADTAMYHVKKQGKNGFQIYNETLEKKPDEYKKEKRGTDKNKVLPIHTWLWKNQKAMLLFCGFFLAMVTVLATFMGVYIHHLKYIVDEESYGYLEEIAAQINVNLIRGLKSNYARMETLGNKVGQSQAVPLRTVQEELYTDQALYGYKEIALIDAQGNWCTPGRKEKYPELLPFLTRMENEGKPVTTEMISVKGSDCAVILYPLENIQIDGQAYIALGAITDMETLNDMLSLTLFQGQGYSHVVTATGNIVIRSTHSNNTFSDNNILTYLEGVTFKDATTVQDIRLDLLSGKSRRIHYMDKGVETLSLYAPIGYNDWYLYTIIPADALQKQSQGFYHLTILVCIIISVIFLLLVAIIFFTQIRSRYTLLQQINTDYITGGRSMRKFEVDVNQAMKAALIPRSMIYANVERFKLVNDQCGKETADGFLRFIYSCIEEDLADGECICRLMADHFGILINSCESYLVQERIKIWNQKIQEYELLKNLPAVHMSYGVYFIQPDAPATAAVLLDRANLARKTAATRTAGAEEIAVYDEKLKQRMALEQELETRQEFALEEKEFVMYLQPKYDPKTGFITGAEALVRWITEDQGMLFPDQYIPLFESNGFIVKLDLYIFEQVCQFLASMSHKGMDLIPISVNLSRVNLNNPSFFERYKSIWMQYDIASSYIEFEITESLIFDDIARFRELIANIRQYGFRVSMDDFGSGYSSLNMLKDIDMDVLKLDKKFFDQAGEATEKADLIVSHVIALAKDLGMQVVAEGVEYKDQVEFLKRLGCDYIQGYYYSRPVPAVTVWEMLEIQNENMRRGNGKDEI